MCVDMQPSAHTLGDEHWLGTTEPDGVRRAQQLLSRGVTVHVVQGVQQQRVGERHSRFAVVAVVIPSPCTCLGPNNSLRKRWSLF